MTKAFKTFLILLTEKYNTVLPTCKARLLWTIEMGKGSLAKTRVPNLEALSSIKNNPFSYFRIAWHLETEISVILNSESCPRPYFQ